MNNLEIAKDMLGLVLIIAGVIRGYRFLVWFGLILILGWEGVKKLKTYFGGD